MQANMLRVPGVVFLILVLPMLLRASPPPTKATDLGNPHLPAKDTPSDPSKSSFPLPDLVILQITKAPAARIHIKNQGKAGSGKCMLSVGCSLGSTQNGISAQGGAIWEVPALKPGADVWISLGKCSPTGAKVDSENAVKESSETNNSYSVKG